MSQARKAEDGGGDIGAKAWSRREVQWADLGTPSGRERSDAKALRLGGTQQEGAWAVAWLPTLPQHLVLPSTGQPSITTSAWLMSA
jgi:hypothetical protein